jgi:two-component system KDP operon response regulator KdpE
MTTHALKILVIDDEAPIRKFLRISLSTEGYNITEAESGKEGLRLTNSIKPDLIVLDLGLPDLDGQEVLRQLRAAEHTQPVMILSVRNDPAQIVQALNNGADDYLVKPFGLPELLARLTALQRRAAQQTTGGNGTLSAGPLEVDFVRHEVRLEGTALELSPKEFMLLKTLASHTNKALTHKFLLQEVWGPAHVDDAQYLRVYMAQLRKRLIHNGKEPPYLRTLPGIGYMFDTTLLETPSSAA